MITINKQKFGKKIPVALFEKILRERLAINDEELLILGDRGYDNKHLVASACASAFSIAANNQGINHSISFQNPRGIKERADVVFLKKLKTLPKKSVIVLNVSGRIGMASYLGQTFRKFVTEKKHRFISLSSLGFIENNNISQLLTALNTDIKDMEKRAKKIKKKLDNAESINVQTKAGTDLTVGIETREARIAIGKYVEPGTGGNGLPGEVYVAPDKKSVNGRVVIDGSIRTLKKTHLVKRPVIIDIKNSDIFSWNNNFESRLLKESIDYAHKSSKNPWGVRRIGELGIGLNTDAKLIGSTLVDEKVSGTAHVAIGSNKFFGGDVSASIHLDQVFKAPLFKVDGKLMDWS